MDVDRDALPDDIVALKDALLVERARALEVTAELMVACQIASNADPRYRGQGRPY